MRAPTNYRSIRYWGQVAVLAAAYVVAAKFGLSLALVAEQVTVVWPPTGISLAAVLLLGYAAWPGIALGAFVANVTAHEPLITALGITAGNTLEALAGAWLLRRWLNFEGALERMKDVLGLVILAGLLSTAVSATIGVTSLCIGGLRPWSDFGLLWYVWWLGDATGALLVAPLLLAWARPLRGFSWIRQGRIVARRLVEVAALLTGVFLIGAVVFAGRFLSILSAYSLEYLIFPFVIWAALRFGPRGTTLVTCLIAALAIWGTVHGYGPFTKGSPHENLILVQTFMAVVAVTALVLSAATVERRTSERRRATDFAVTHVLAEATSLKEAAPRILRTMCENLDWDVGAIWAVHPSDGVLRCVEVWQRAPATASEFETQCRERTFTLGIGLPGRVWESGRPAWIPDVVHDANFPRAPIAARENLHGAFGAPIITGHGVQGVIEFFSRRIRQPDDQLLQMFGTIGGQIGQFLDRKQAEEALRDADRRKDEFLATLAHELRNPLAPVSNALHVLRLPESDADMLKAAHNIIDRQVAQLVRLIDDLMDVSRITRGKVYLKAEHVTLESIIHDALELSRPWIDAAGLALTVTLPPASVHLTVDPMRVSQVLCNLLNNAAKFTERGGTIWLSAELDGRPSGHAVLIRVRNSGIGIPPDMLARVFDPFTQVDRSLERPRGGLGIGLTLARDLVEMHGGTLTAMSDGPGRGSEFVVRLPTRDA